MAQGTTKGVPIDTDPLLTADSDLLVPSQKAVKTYAQPQLNGTGFVKASGTTISYDNSTYLTAAITSLGGLTGATQTLATGTSGTDFAISSSGTSHTFNLPTASSSNTGKLSSSDWTTFNNKMTDNSWVDYSATTTTTGWGSFTTKKIQYKLIGANTLLVQFQLEGTSNASSASFTLPNNASSWGTQYFLFHVTNTSAQVAGLGLINASSNVVSFSVNLSAGGTSSWSSTGAKNVRGQVIVSI
jgi:hypothetical protein